MFWMIRGLLLSWIFYFYETLSGSMTQFFIDLGVKLEI
jgi:hypothetical protein